MRSFIDYRKDKLQRELNNLSIREAINNRFDIILSELLNTVKLPPLLLENQSIVAKSAYDNARKEDYQDNKFLIEFLINHYKCNFYNNLVVEAEQALAANPFVNFKTLISAKVKEFIQNLKGEIGSLLSITRPAADAPEEAPEMPQARSIPQAPPINTGSGSVNSQNIDSSEPSGNSNQLSGNSNQSYNSQRPSSSGNGPSSNNSFKPAPMGHIKPSDGWFKGLKRTLYDPIAGWVKNKWRNFRRRWHNDPQRENFQLIETMFLENLDNISKLLDKASDALIKDIVAKCDELEKQVKGSVTPVANPAPVSNVASTTPAAQTPAGVVPMRSRDQEMEDPVDDVAPEFKAAPNEIPSEDVVVNEKDAKSAAKGASYIGLVMNGLGARGGTSKLRATNFSDQNGQQLVDSNSWSRLRGQLVVKIYDLIKEKDPEFIKKYNEMHRERISKSKRTDTIKSWLGVDTIKSKKSIVDMLVALNNKMNRLTMNVHEDPKPVAPEPASTVTPEPAVAAKATPSVSPEPASTVAPEPAVAAKATPSVSPEPASTVAPEPAVAAKAAPSATPEPKESPSEQFLNYFKKEHPEAWSKLEKGSDLEDVKSRIDGALQNYSFEQVSNFLLDKINKEFVADVAAKASPEVVRPPRKASPIRSSEPAVPEQKPVETPKEVQKDEPKKQEPLNQDAEKVFDDLLNRNEYWSAIKKYKRLVTDNNNGDDSIGDQATEKLEDEVRELVKQGKNVDELMSYINSNVEEEIRKGDEVDADKYEGFNGVLQRFLKKLNA